jgi:formylglycine-generating enzyme required for sulfatase activity
MKSLATLAALACCGGKPIAALVREGAVVRVPQGHYVVGCDDRTLCGDNRRRVVATRGFLIDRLEVTVRAYRACVDAGVCVEHVSKETDPAEVASARITDAEAYCALRKGRLPTDEEWEIAARGRDERIFPWGNAYEEDRVGEIVVDHRHGMATVVGGRAPTGASPFGVLDMSGTWPEFTQRTPTGSLHIRGGGPSGWFTNDVYDVSAVRITSVSRDHYAAIRCVYPAD